MCILYRCQGPSQCAKKTYVGDSISNTTLAKTWSAKDKDHCNREKMAQLAGSKDKMQSQVWTAQSEKHHAW